MAGGREGTILPYSELRVATARAGKREGRWKTSGRLTVGQAKIGRNALGQRANANQKKSLLQDKGKQFGG